MAFRICFYSDEANAAPAVGSSVVSATGAASKLKSRSNQLSQMLGVFINLHKTGTHNTQEQRLN